MQIKILFLLFRKNSAHHQESTPNKRFRFMDGFTTKYIAKADFKTDEGWANFIRYVTIQNKKNKAICQSILRKQNKINSFKQLINSLKGKETAAAAKYLQVIF